MQNVISEINRRGYLINSLSQLDNTTWQCNIRSIDNDTVFYDFSHGTTALEALQKGLLMIERVKDKPHNGKHQHADAVDKKPITQTVDDFDEFVDDTDEFNDLF